MIVAHDTMLRNKCKLVMNHGEAVINDYASNPNRRNKAIVNRYQSALGLNLRMTEIQAAIAREQLKKLDENIRQRRENVLALNRDIHVIPAISRPPIRAGCTHVYYVLPYLWDSNKADGLERDEFLNAVRAELMPRKGRDGEGIQIGGGYIKPIFLMPYFEQVETNYIRYQGEMECPVVKNLWANRLFLTLYHAPNSTVKDMESVGEAFHKVWAHRDELK